VGLVDARPGRALKLVAPEPEPIFVAQEVLADAEAKAEGDSAEAILRG
jgi:bifunctional DNase/RNase